MEFGLTAAVQKRLKIENTLSAGGETDPRFCWEVNLTKLQNKNVLLIVNASSRYCVVCANMKPSFWKNMDASLHDAIFAAMVEDGFSEQEAEAYFKKAGEIKLTKTHGKKFIGGLNHITSILIYFLCPFDEGLLQKQLMNDLNADSASTPFHPEYKYITPNEFFRDEIKKLLYGEEPKLKFTVIQGGGIRKGIW